MELIRCLIENQTTAEACVQWFFAHAHHLGEGIDKCERAARSNGLTHAEAREAIAISAEDIDMDVLPSPDEDVFWGDTRYGFPPDRVFHYPIGIIASGIKGVYEVELDPDDISSGYERIDGADGLTSIEINAESGNLLSHYERILSHCDSYRVFWYELKDFWNDIPKQIFVNESLDTPAKIVSHIRNNRDDSLHNGFVALTAYLDEGATNICVSDHKRIEILTYSPDVADSYESIARELGYSLDAQLVSFSRGVHHTHYRPTASMERDALEASLLASGFSLWEPDD